MHICDLKPHSFIPNISGDKFIWGCITFHPQEVLLAQCSLYVHKDGLKPHFISFHALVLIHSKITQQNFPWNLGRISCFRPLCITVNQTMFQIFFSQISTDFHEILQTILESPAKYCENVIKNYCAVQKLEHLACNTRLLGLSRDVVITNLLFNYWISLWISRYWAEDSKKVFAKFHENLLRIDWEIDKKHVLYYRLMSERSPTFEIRYVIIKKSCLISEPDPSFKERKCFFSAHS